MAFAQVESQGRNTGAGQSLPRNTERMNVRPEAVVVPTGAYFRYGKRMLDIAFVLAMAPLVLPLVALLALAVALDGANPFFGHKRIGRNGRAFVCWKLRSMVPDAEHRLRDHLASDADARREWEQKFKLTDDPRITAVGRLLRRTSLDELPQFWNVLKGEMSLVGPRPVVRTELRRYAGLSRAYMSVRPGVTGIWQVAGRNDIEHDDRAVMEAGYVASLSLRNDLSILWRTVGVVLRRTGI